MGRLIGHWEGIGRGATERSCFEVDWVVHYCQATVLPCWGIPCVLMGEGVEERWNVRSEW